MNYKCSQCGWIGTKKEFITTQYKVEDYTEEYDRCCPNCHFIFPIELDKFRHKYPTVTLYGIFNSCEYVGDFFYNKVFLTEEEAYEEIDRMQEDEDNSDNLWVSQITGEGKIADLLKRIT